MKAGGGGFSTRVGALALTLLVQRVALAEPNMGAPQGKGPPHMSSKEMEETHAQWFADPERGWVRSQERHELHDERHQAPHPRRKAANTKAHVDKEKRAGKESRQVISESY